MTIRTLFTDTPFMHRFFRTNLASDILVVVMAFAAIPFRSLGGILLIIMMTLTALQTRSVLVRMKPVVKNNRSAFGFKKDTGNVMMPMDEMG
ncbi:MAG: hypothetical protein A2293_16860 [Elusimicrobia bacterium RIFOXYB2_FULL_49_7]|nr:MAG: hypothetical protein A2293_16860 [Elusimicrobia bacterium RIFOXYB2_FULL_49_7]